MAPVRRAHRESEQVGQHADGKEAEGDDGKQDVGAQNAQRRNAAEVVEEFLLLHRKPRVEYDGRQKVPAIKFQWDLGYSDYI